MNTKVKRENALSLAQIVGVAENEAAELLNTTAVITFDPKESQASELADWVARMLERTIEHVSTNSGAEAGLAAEIVIGRGIPRFSIPRVYVWFSGRTVHVGWKSGRHAGDILPRISLILGACYTCAATLKTILGERLPFPVPEEYVVNIDELLGDDAEIIDTEVDFDEAFLAGAGAIGNGFIVGLSALSAKGTLHIADDDSVSAGNLQRCLLFDEKDNGAKKVDVLAKAAEALMPMVKAIPEAVRLADVPENNGKNWLKRLVVTVDSPRARRQLQSEFPGEVFDASTTTAEEIVFHFHKQPTDGACLACVYENTPDENAHAEHIAETLGVTLEMVQKERISAVAANMIQKQYPRIIPSDIIGVPYDTLFKELCSAQKLVTSEGAQVLTPFAFVSTLAGALLALEFVRRTGRGNHNNLFNYWRISPWFTPIPKLRSKMPNRRDCEFCAQPIFADIIQQFWAQ